MGTLAVAAVVSGGAAYAATKDDSPQARSQAIVDDAAGTLGVDPSKLSDALKKALENQVDAQVTAGKLTQAQGDAIKKRIEDGTQPIFGGPASAARRHFGHRGFGVGFGGTAASAPASASAGPASMAGIDDVGDVLGLKPADLRTQLRSGKSLSAVARARAGRPPASRPASTSSRRTSACKTAG